MGQCGPYIGPCIVAHTNYAWVAGWLALVKMLVQQKAEVCSTCNSLQTALHFAAEMGHVDVVAALLDAAGKQLIVMKDQGNWTPLHHAAEQGSVEIVELLICVRIPDQCWAVLGYRASHCGALLVLPGSLFPSAL